LHGTLKWVCGKVWFTTCSSYAASLLAMSDADWRQKLHRHREIYTLQHTATHCNTLQHTATHCNTLSDADWRQKLHRHREICQEIHGNKKLYNECVAVCCSVLQCVAVCCSVLQCVAVCCSVLLCDVCVYCKYCCVALANWQLRAR